MREMAKSEAREEWLRDLLITAVEGGINYWASVSDYRPDEGSVTVHDEEDGDTYSVTTDTIATAVGKFMRGENGCQFIESAGDGQFKLSNRTNGEDGDYDAGDADCILQIACFGEVVYG